MESSNALVVHSILRISESVQQILLCLKIDKPVSDQDGADAKKVCIIRRRASCLDNLFHRVNS